VALLFSPPSVNDGAAYRADADIVTRKLWGHMARHNTGVTVLKTDGVYINQQYPYHDDLVAADLYYLGGHIYDVDLDEAAALVEAGYDLSGYGVWAQALLQRDTNAAVIAAFGDSITEGQGASTVSLRWLTLLQTSLRVAYPTTDVTGGFGFIPAWYAAAGLTDPTTGGTPVNDTVFGPGFRAFDLESGDTVMWTVEGTHVRVLYPGIGSDRAISVSIDGEAPFILDAETGAGFQERWVVLPTGGPGSHTVLVEWVAGGGSGIAYIEGVWPLDGDEPTDGYLYCPGSNSSGVSSVDKAAFDITGDIDVRIEITPDDEAPNVVNSLIGKWNDFFTNHRSWRLFLNTNGTYGFEWSPDGLLATVQTANSSSPSLSGRRHARITLDVDDGSSGHVVRFYESEDGADWDEIGTTGAGPTRPGTTSIFSSTADIYIGRISSTTPLPYTGRVHTAKVLTGIAGTEVANPDFTYPGTTPVYDPLGNRWGILGFATMGYDGNGAGVTIVDFGHAGFKAGDMIAGARDDVVADQLADLNPDQVIIEYGANERAAQDDPADFAANLQTLITLIRTAVPAVPILMVAIWAPLNVGTILWEEYVQAMRDVADANDDITLVDFTDPDEPEVTLADTVHPDDAGHATVAARLLLELDPVTSSAV
jgi:lysophospholipase L1-like esterase